MYLNVRPMFNSFIHILNKINIYSFCLQQHNTLMVDMYMYTNPSVVIDFSKGVLMS